MGRTTPFFPPLLRFEDLVVESEADIDQSTNGSTHAHTHIIHIMGRCGRKRKGKKK